MVTHDSGGHHHPPTSFIRKYIFSTDHKVIGLQYYFLALFSVFLGMALSMFVALNGAIMSGARVPFTMSRDGYFFSALGQVHPRFHTPSVSIFVQAVLSILLLLAAATFKELLELAIYAEWLFYMIAGSTIFVFRRRHPDQGGVQESPVLITVNGQIVDLRLGHRMIAVVA